ncbi:MAG: formate/nitrite transporter family protein [Verrucomicrobiales bacterium]|nr:formate/nitrite transporter family protein [Verrucomicrobiales bacterium]
MSDLFGSDAYSPAQIADRVEKVGIAKAHLPFVKLFALGILAGGFIGLGALSFLIVVSDASLSFAASRVLGGVAFSLGLVLVVVAGAELFTGNNLMVMALVNRRITLRLALRNFTLVYLANFVGAVGLAWVVARSGHLEMNEGAIREAAGHIAAAKLDLTFSEAFLRGVLCNILVCLAVWLSLAGRSVTDRILAVIFPVSAFVAAGFEHCVANMYLVPLAIFSNPEAGIGWGDFLLSNLLPVTFGNLFGGAGMVGLVYWTIYGRDEVTRTETPPIESPDR